MNGDMIEPIPDRRLLEAEYESRRQAYHSLLEDLERLVRDLLEEAGLHPTIKGRIKTFESLYKKRIRILRKAREEKLAPISIDDIVGLRIVCPFLGDLSRAELAIGSKLKIVEVERKGAERSFREFGYESVHLLIELPLELKEARPGLDIGRCEIQLRTILQEAWAEVEHELVYKAEFTPFDEPMKRKLAALNANLSLSDIIFQEIRDYQHRLSSELASRRTAFYAKIEEAIDGSLLGHPSLGSTAPREEVDLELGSGSTSGEGSLDDLLLEALYAHNRKDYDKAISIYGAILSASPPREVSALIHKHRGMAYFSESRYEEAAEDFGRSLELNPGCYKSAYFRGVVRSVIQDYGAALEDFNNSLRINPYQFFALYRRAQAYWHLGDYPKTIADCEAALRIEPASRQALELRKLAHEKLRM